MVRVMREVADFINARPQDLVFTPNATTGLNVVLRSAGLGPGTALYMLDIGYGSVKKMANVISAPRRVYPPGHSGADGDDGDGSGGGVSASEQLAEGAAAAGCEVVMGQVRFPIG